LSTIKIKTEDKKIILKSLYFFADLFSINISFFLSTLIFYGFSFQHYLDNLSGIIFVASVLLILLISIFQLYKLENKIEKRDLLIRIAVILAIFILAISSFNYLVPSYNYSWPFLFVFYLFTIIFIVVLRLFIFNIEQKSNMVLNIAVVGEVGEVKELISKINSKPAEYNLTTVIVNKSDNDLAEKLTDDITIYFGFKWLEPTVARLEDIDILLLAYNELDDKLKARLFNLKTSSKTKVYILPKNFDPEFFDPELTKKAKQ
jgi:FlaA1/EpsC-like NDP-sugar epimerase